MTVSLLAEKCGFEPVNISDPDREICGGYVGDLLSWVMGRAGEGCAWITIMSNVNIVAVASLVDVSCIILSEGVKLDEEIIKTASEKGVNILSTKLASYEAAALISKMI